MEKHSSQPNILCANDDPASRRQLESFFRRAGWHFEIVNDPDSALKAVGSRDFDIVIADFCMPAKVSLGLLRSIKSVAQLPVVVVMNNNSGVSEILGMVSEGADDILQKPLALDSLEHRVKRILAAEHKREFLNGFSSFVRSERMVMELTTVEACESRMPFVLAERLCRGGRIDRNLKLHLELAFQEAMANSIEHGNLELQSEWKEMVSDEGEDQYSIIKKERLLNEKYASRILIIEMSFCENELAVIIRDQGQGFDQRVVTGEIAGDIQCFGRGISIIRSTMDKVEYLDSGREIRMIKYI